LRGKGFQFENKQKSWSWMEKKSRRKGRKKRHAFLMVLQEQKKDGKS